MVSLQKIFLHLLFLPAYFRHSNASLLVSGIFIIMLLASCGNSDKEVNEYNSKSLGVEEITNADINYTLGGNAKAKLQSPLMLRVQDASAYVEFPKKLHVDFFK